MTRLTLIVTFGLAFLQSKASELFLARWTATTIAFHYQCCDDWQTARLGFDIAFALNFPDSGNLTQSRTPHFHSDCCTASLPSHLTCKPASCCQKKSTTEFITCVLRSLGPFGAQSSAFSQPPQCRTSCASGPSPICKPTLHSTQSFCWLTTESPSTNEGCRWSTNLEMRASLLTFSCVCE